MKIMILKNIVSALTSIRGFILTGKSNSLKEEQIYLYTRQQNATHLKKYSNKLNGQKSRVEPLIEEIAVACRNSLNKIANRTDICSQFLNDEDRSPATRHIFWSIIRNLFNAFSYEMTWQTTSNLYSRFRRILDLQLEYTEFSTKREKINFPDLYEKKECCRVEGMLFNTKEFVQLLSAFFDRITYSEEFYQSVLSDVESVFMLIEKNRKVLKDEIAAVEVAQKENHIEEIKIEDSPDLYNAYKLFERKMSFIDNYFLIEEWAKYDIKELRLSQVLIIGFFLIMLANHDSWGNHTGLGT